MRRQLIKKDIEAKAQQLINETKTITAETGQRRANDPSTSRRAEEDNSLAVEPLTSRRISDESLCTKEVLRHIANQHPEEWLTNRAIPMVCGLLRDKRDRERSGMDLSLMLPSKSKSASRLHVEMLRGSVVHSVLKYAVHPDFSAEHYPELASIVVNDPQRKEIEEELKRCTQADPVSLTKHRVGRKKFQRLPEKMSKAMIHGAKLVQRHAAEILHHAEEMIPSDSTRGDEGPPFVPLPSLRDQRGGGVFRTDSVSPVRKAQFEPVRRHRNPPTTECDSVHATKNDSERSRHSLPFWIRIVIVCSIVTAFTIVLGVVAYALHRRRKNRSAEATPGSAGHNR